jgi:competence protein ComEC
MGWVSVPLAPVALAFAVGIALAPLAPEAVAWWTWGFGTGTASLLALRGRSRDATGPLLLAVAALGALRAIAPPLAVDHVARLPLPATARLEGRLAAEPIRWAADRTRVLLEAERADGERRTGRIQATLYGEPPALAGGQRVAAELRLYPAVGFRNPGVFDYAAHLAREDIHVLGTGRAERVVPLDDPAPGWTLQVRRRALAIMREALPPASAALLGGLLLGDRTALPRDLDDAFRRAGVYHILAVSGFNVALVAASVFALFGAARAGRKLAAAAALLAVLAFALVVGSEPSVLRATIMGVLVLGAVILERDAAVLNGLALAALIVLAIRPADLLDPGFQLSFAATGAIVLAPLPRGALLGALGVSTVAQLAVLPITLTHFNQVSTIGVVANLAVVPLAGAATILGLSGVALSAAAGAIGAFLLDATWPVLIALRAVVMVAALVPGAVLHLPAPHWTAVGAYVAALALLAAKGRGNGPRRAGVTAIGVAALLAMAIAVELWPIVRPERGRLRVTVLDVGQGDAIVVETPDGLAALVDAGPGGPQRLDTGERVVAPFLWNRGHLSLAGTLVTHMDADHAGGIGAVRRLFRVTDPGTVELLFAQLRRSGVEASLVSGPGGPAIDAARPSGNEQARALRLELGLVSFLLASDITPRAEGELLRRGVPLAATVLKVAHHGAQGSSTPEFLRAVQPLAAAISVGARNPYGHPSPATLTRLQEAGVAVYRTDRDGAVVFETDGRTLTVTTWATGRRARYCLDSETIC